MRMTRRDLLRLASVSLSASVSGWLPALAQEAANHPQRRRACILLWLNGGPSTIDLWDLKPGHANGGPYRPIDTNVPGLRISEHLPRLAQRANRLALLRGMSTREADHGRATYLMHTGYMPSGAIQYPAIGALVAKELERPEQDLPNFVSIAPSRLLNQAAYDSGFLGPQYAPLIVGEAVGLQFGPQQPGQDIDAALRVQNLALPRGVEPQRARARVSLLDQLEADFIASRGDNGPAQSHRSAYRRAFTMMNSASVQAFELAREPDAVRDRYGRTLFGQGCLLARCLVEVGVPFVEVTLDGWDTHVQNFNAVRGLARILDQAFATLLDDLHDRGLLATTAIMCMGEFGRTPRINANQGRDHWANSWTTVLAGGGIRGGTVVGRTNDAGTEVTDRPTSVSDLLATLGLALGIDIATQNQSNVGRPIRFVDAAARPVREVLA
jgi:uncharacterized protein (DUF1501 family)